MRDGLDELLQQGTYPANRPIGQIPDEPKAPIRSSQLARRQRVLLWGACGAALLSTGGLVASAWVKSPAEVAADTKAPKGSVITAPVVSQVLKNTLVFRGSFAAAQTVTFTPASTVGPNSRSGGGASLVVSKVLAKNGTKVHAGEVLIEVAYRPIFALKGTVPMVRDLVQGDSGQDVAELQRALAEVGFSSGGDKPGVFSTGMAAAVKGFYKSIGYDSPVAEIGAAGTAGAKSGGNGGGKSGGTAGGKGPAAQSGSVPGRSGATTTGRKPSSSPTVRAPTKQSSPQVGVEVPMSEVMFVPSFPALVTNLSASVGAKVSDPLLTLSSDGLQLTAKLDPGQVSAVKRGMAVRVLSETTGDQASGRVADVGKQVMPGQGLTDPTTGGQGGAGSTGLTGAGGSGRVGQGNASSSVPYVPVSIAPDRAWAPSLNGQDVRITITSVATDGPVLAVPESAVTSAADEITSVTVIGSGGVRRRVRVTPGISAEGLVQVTPVDGAITEGEQVVVGQ